MPVVYRQVTMDFSRREQGMIFGTLEIEAACSPVDYTLQPANFSIRYESCRHIDRIQFYLEASRRMAAVCLRRSPEHTRLTWLGPVVLTTTLRHHQ